jgi:hypothetical protein
MSFGWSVDVGFRNLCIVLYQKSLPRVKILHVSLTRFTAHPRKHKLKFRYNLKCFLRSLLAKHAKIIACIDPNCKKLDHVIVEAQLRVNKLAQMVSAALGALLKSESSTDLHIPRPTKVQANIKLQLYSPAERSKLKPGTKFKKFRKAQSTKTFLEGVPAEARKQFEIFPQMHDVADAVLQAVAFHKKDK